MAQIAKFPFLLPGLIFVVDSADRERIHEAKEELFSIMDFPDMAGVPVCVIANKQDLPSKLKFFIIH